MASGWQPAHLLLVASALTALLGVVVLARNPGRGLNRAFFAFAALNGAAGALAAQTFLHTGSPQALAAIRTYWFFVPWVWVSLVVLALHVPTAEGSALRRPWSTHGALVVPAGMATALYALQPTWFLQEASLNGVAYYAYGPAAIVVVALRGVAAAVAVVLLARRMRRTPHELQRVQLAWMQAGLFVGLVPFLSLDFVRLLVALPTSPTLLGIGVGAAVFHLAAWSSLRPLDRSLLRDEERQVVAVAYLAGTISTLVVGLLGTKAAMDLFYGLVALAFPLMITYAILKYDAFNLDIRLRQAAPYLTLTLMLASAFALFMAVAARLSPAADASRVFLVAGLLTAASAVPIHRASTRLSTRLGWTRRSDTGSVAERRLEVYRAAVENAVTRGEDPDASETLSDLRERLALSTRDHRFTVQVVRDAAVAPVTAPRGPLREGDVVMRKYRVERFLGSGTFGRALLARHTSMDRLVVIKEPHEGYRTRHSLQQLSKEARLAARVRHPNVVALYDFEELADTGYLVFEYVPGGSLEDRLKHGPLPRADAYRVFRDIVQGLDAIHRQRIVHMDLKPANILLDLEGHAKITDFGIANEERVTATLGRSVGPQSHPGTLLYMAPEQVRGRRDPGPQADLYAAGAIFHEMLTGSRYLDFPESPLLAQEAILYREPRLDDPRLTPAEQDLLASLLAKAPADRPLEAADVLARVPEPAATGRGRVEGRETAVDEPRPREA